jgi:hypothetical protein
MRTGLRPIPAISTAVMGALLVLMVYHFDSISYVPQEAASSNSK